MVTGYTRFGSTRFEDVVDAYEHALLSLYPRPRYVVGWDARILGRIMIYAPEWMSDWLSRKGDRKLPSPAALAKL